MPEVKKRGHGQRKHIQVLLEKNKGNLFVEHCKENGEKPSAVIRELVYEYLKVVCPKDKYFIAEEKMLSNGEKLLIID